MVLYESPPLYSFGDFQQMSMNYDPNDLYSVMDEHDRLSNMLELYETNHAITPFDTNQVEGDFEIHLDHLHDRELDLKTPLLQAMFSRAINEGTPQEINLQKIEEDRLFQHASIIFNEDTENRVPLGQIQQEINQLIINFLQDPRNGYEFANGTGFHHLTRKGNKIFMGKYRTRLN